MSGNCADCVEHCAGTAQRVLAHDLKWSLAGSICQFQGGAAMYEPHYEEESGGGGFLIGLLCGTALGAAIGLMFAPKVGSEMRQRIIRFNRRYPPEGVRDLRQATEQVNTVADEGDVRRSSAARKRSTARVSRRRQATAATAAPPSLAASRDPGCPTSTRARARPAAPSHAQHVRQRAEGARGILALALPHLSTAPPAGLSPARHVGPSTA